MDERWSDALQRVTHRVDSSGAVPDEGFPHYADSATGEWMKSSDGDWTGGFWPGQVWLIGTTLQESASNERAIGWSRRLRVRASSETIFRGFLFWYGAAIGSILNSHDEAGAIALEGAAGLARSYLPGAGLIPLGREAEEASDVGVDVANIDGVPGTVALLAWASEQTRNPALLEMARSHALRHRELCLRDDGSIIQSASFDIGTGALKRRFTHKGLRDDTTWTRAQAWGMLGFAHAARWVDPEFVSTAIIAADWWLDHLPADGVAYWDFDVEAAGEPRDTSGTAIAAAALLKIAALTGGRDGERYRLGAERMVQALINAYLTPVGEGDQRPPGILTHGCYNRRIGLAVSNELVWGDYFLVEALLGLRGDLDPLSV